MTERKFQDKNWGFEIHKRLIAKDPIAPAELAEVFLEPLVKSIASSFSFVKDDHKIQDAVTDTLISYIQRPSQFNPLKSNLWSFLVMSAKRDLQNINAKQYRLDIKEKVSESVEVLMDSGNKEIEKINDLPLNNVISMEMQQRMNNLFDDPKDREILELMLHGERVTEKYSLILGIENLSISEQRKIVKQHKDRIGKKLTRLREKMNEFKKNK